MEKLQASFDLKKSESDYSDYIETLQVKNSNLLERIDRLNDSLTKANAKIDNLTANLTQMTEQHLIALDKIKELDCHLDLHLNQQDVIQELNERIERMEQQALVRQDSPFQAPLGMNYFSLFTQWIMARLNSILYKN